MVPSGIDIGTPALTTRGFLEDDFIKVAYLIHEGVKIAIKAKVFVQGMKLKYFIEFIETEYFQ